MTYDHIQQGKLHYLLWAIAAVLLVPILVFPREPRAFIIPLLTAVVLVLAGSMFTWLRIHDEGEHLAAHFGPLPVFRKRIPYKEITGVEPSRSGLIDGWGIHYTPGRGWIYNVWGRDCVKIFLGRKVVRLGTDDPEGLAEFLRSRMISSDSDHPVRA